MASTALPFLPAYPASLPRRLRRDAFSRALVRESQLTAADLIFPVFVLDGQKRAEDVGSMPGVQRLSVDRLFALAEQCLNLGVPVMALFPVIDADKKTPDGREASNPEGLVPRTVRELKKRFPELGLLTDVALDPFTTHGQDGLIDDAGYIVNDDTVAVLVQQALVQAQAGVELPFNSERAEREAFWRVAAGRTFVTGAFGRAWTPMVEFAAARELESGESTLWDIVPQVQVSLNTRQHLLANRGLCQRDDGHIQARWWKCQALPRRRGTQGKVR